MTTTPAGRRRGRPPKNQSSAQAAEDLLGTPPPTPKDEEPDLSGLDLAEVYGGVSAAWLGHVFGMDKNTIKKKLAKCEVAGRNRGTPLYRIKDAAAWLVPPKVDLMTYIKSLRPQDMPPQLNDAYWSAMGKRQKVLQEAGELWRTPDVLDVFGKAAIKIKSTVQLWTDEVDRVHGLSDEQRAMLIRMADGLLEDIHEIFISAPRQGSTRSTITEHDDAAPAEELDDLI